jgi:hypothetical protein
MISRVVIKIIVITDLWIMFHVLFYLLLLQFIRYESSNISRFGIAYISAD